MLLGVQLAILALSCAGIVAGQGTLYQLTMSVSNPAPVPGQPFTITWTGGEANEAVYIVLNNYFPNLPNQDIIYGGMDILSNAPNNGSWTYHVPLNIEAGRHSFSIGYNPLMLSATSDIFTILPSQTSYVPPGSTSTPTGTAAWTYNGCGLPPLPDYTYTGFQPPCTTTVGGKVETLYPIVPASDSSIFYPELLTTHPALTTNSVTVPLTTATRNTAFATGLAQALQCRVQVTPSITSITVASVTTLFSLVGCSTNTAVSPPPTSNEGGVCHTSGYTTFSVSGTSSVCCPNGWATTPLDTELYCFTSFGSGNVGKRQVSTETLGVGASSTLVELQGVVFTSAGLVTQEAAVQTGSSTTQSGSTSTRAAASETSTKKSSGARPEFSSRTLRGFVVLGAFCIFYL